MATTIKLKNSVTTTNAPSSLVQGEVAINVTDKKVWVGNAATTPVQLLGTGADGTLSTLTVGAGTVSLPSITTTGDTNTGIFFPAADTIAFTEGGAESMRIDSSGNVGIGTSSPASLIHVQRSNDGTIGTFRGTSNAQLLLGISSGNLVYDSSNGNATHVWQANSSERMRIDSSGNVGIGTSSPASQLDITKTGDAVISLTSSGVQRYQLITRSGGRFDFQDQSAGATRWSVDQNGNFFIGKTAADTTNAGIWAYNSAGQGRINFIKGTESGTGATSTCVFYYNGTSVGSITSSSTATAYNTSSDYRLKENIAPMTGALATVSALKPCTYTWKADGSSGQGFIAHELQAVVPDCVTGEKDAVDAEGKPQYQGIDTSFLVATLTAALQEAHGLIKDLQSRVDVLEGK